MGASSHQKGTNKKAAGKMTKTTIKFSKPKAGKKFAHKVTGPLAFGAATGKRKIAAVRGKLKRRPKVKR